MAARRTRRSRLTAFAAVSLLAPGVALAAGLEVPDNGAYVLARGGTAGALDGTAYSLMFNPAGLTGIDSWDIRVDARLVDNAVTFTRSPLPYNGPLGPVTFSQVSNQAGPSLAPSALVAYHPQGRILRQFAFGVGVYAPPGVGAYQYPNPSQVFAETGDPDATNAMTGQRYSLIQNSNLILYPSIAIAWSPVHWLSAGITVQSVYASVSFSQAIAAQSVSGFESYQNDGLASLKVTDPAQPTFVAGLMFRPIDGLTIGGTFRPQVALDATGNIDISPPPGFGNVSQMGTAASLKLNLAPEARLGFGYEHGRWSIAADGVYEGWSVYRNLVLSAPNVNIIQCMHTDTTTGACTESTSTPLGTTILKQNWSDTYSGRLGGSFRILTQSPNRDFGLQVHLGGLFETNAVPSSSQTISQVTGTRIGFSTGVTLAYGDVAFTAAAMYYVPVTLTVTNSTATRAVATGGPDATCSSTAPTSSTNTTGCPVYIGNGTYTSNIWIASVGIAWTPHTRF